MVERRMASLQTDAASYGLWLKDSSGADFSLTRTHTHTTHTHAAYRWAGIRLLNPEDNLWLLRAGFEANARLVYSKVVPV